MTPIHRPTPSLDLPYCSGADFLKNIRQSIKRLHIKSPSGHHFISRHGLSRLFTPFLIKQLISSHVPFPPDRSLVATFTLRSKEISQDFPCVFALLISLDMERYIPNFLIKSRGDAKLPFSRQDLVDVAGDDGLLECGLLEEQWKYLVPVFSTEMREKHGEWGQETVLPFVEDEKLPPSSGKGGFAHVYKVKIHPDFDELYDKQKMPNHDHVYARKELLVPNVEDFKLEALVAMMVSSNQNTNICPLLAAYTHNGACNLIFPFADSNLKTYWEKTPPPASTSERLKFMSRIAALAGGLHKIHVVEWHHGHEELTYCAYHRDLKPTNILVKDGRFMIADFGLALFNTVNIITPGDLRREGSAGSGLPFIHGLGTYRAPECGEKKKAGRAADVWSLGCIFAEILAYVVLGQEGPREFAMKRQRGGQRDFFHDCKNNVLKPVVEEFFDEIVQKPDGVRDPFVGDWLALVRWMLKVNKKERPRIEQVVERLQVVLDTERKRLDGQAADVVHGLNFEEVPGMFTPGYTVTTPRSSSSSGTPSLAPLQVSAPLNSGSSSPSTNTPAQQPSRSRSSSTNIQTPEIIQSPVTITPSTPTKAPTSPFLQGLQSINLWSTSWIFGSSKSNGTSPAPSTPPKYRPEVGRAPGTVPQVKLLHDRGRATDGRDSGRPRAQSEVRHPPVPSSSPMRISHSQNPMVGGGGGDSSGMYQMASGSGRNRVQAPIPWTLDPSTRMPASFPGPNNSNPSLSKSTIEAISTPRILASNIPNPHTRNSSISSMGLSVQSNRKPKDPLQELRGQDTVFLIDDNPDTNLTWPRLRQTLSLLASVALNYNNNGIDILYLYSGAQYPGCPTIDSVLASFDQSISQKEPLKYSSLALRLDGILSDYMFAFRPSRDIKPLNLIVLTPGDISADNSFEDIVLRWAKRFDEVEAPFMQVGIQFVAVDANEDEWERLKALDDSSAGVRDIVDATRFDPDWELDPELLQKIMLGATNRRLDEKEVTPEFRGNGDDGSDVGGGVFENYITYENGITMDRRGNIS